jgi:uncharacterized membrane protein YfcA
MTQAVELGFAAAGAAILGSMLGLGGGVFLVPIFTLFFGIDEKIAIGASAVAVVMNSVVGSSVHLRSRFTNLRLATLLQITTASGALVGALLAVNAPTRLLSGLFGVVLTYAAISMLLHRSRPAPLYDLGTDKLGLAATYYDPAIGRQVTYFPARIRAGLAVSGVAGLISGMLGIGGGVVQVPAMNLLMLVPVKAAAGTSAFMVGITAVATSFVFYADNKIDQTVVVPALLGIVVGAQIGSRLTRRIRANRLVMIFVVVLLYLGARLILRALDMEI